MINELKTLTIDGIECYEKDGVAYLRLETVARGLGFTQTQVKNGKEYASVRWERVEQYLAELGFPHKWGKDDFIPENVFYRLAMKAKNEVAERFQAKIADEVIPAIRKHGAYMTPEKIDEILLNPDTIIKLATSLKEEKQKRKLLEQKVIDDAPKVLFADAVAGSDTSIHVGDLAKFICQNGVKIGRGRLFAWMRENGYLVKDGSNIPTQRSIENGWMEIKESVVETKNGTLVTRTPLVTGKGQRFFVNRILRHKEVSYSAR